MKIQHDIITAGLGNNRCRADFRNEAVTVDYRFYSTLQQRTMITINKNPVGLDFQGGDRSLHGQ